MVLADSGSLRTGRENMKKFYLILCAVILLATISACGENAPSSQNDLGPKKSEEVETDNPFLLADFSISAVCSGSGDIIGNYGYIEVEKSQIPDFNDPEFSRWMAGFAEKRVKNSGHNWVSIILGDGTGFCFTGANGVIAAYGKLDYDGSIIKTLGVCELSSETNNFVYTDYCIREIPSPTPMQQGLVPDNFFAPAPEEIFTSPASENGLADTAFYAEGTVVRRFDLAGYDTIQLSTENGDILISATFIEFSNLSEGDQATSFFLYTGMSTDYELPCGIYVYHE